MLVSVLMVNRQLASDVKYPAINQNSLGVADSHFEISPLASQIVGFITCTSFIRRVFVFTTQDFLLKGTMER